MYLKDCILTQVGFKPFHPAFVLKDDNLDYYESLTPAGGVLYHHPKYQVEALTGTPISDRDYRLAIARAKALQNQTS